MPWLLLPLLLLVIPNDSSVIVNERQGDQRDVYYIAEQEDLVPAESHQFSAVVSADLDTAATGKNIISLLYSSTDDLSYNSIFIL